MPKATQYKHPTTIVALDREYFKNIDTSDRIFKYNYSDLIDNASPYIVLRQRGWLDGTNPGHELHGVGDVRFPQILPYQILTQLDDKGNIRILTYRRVDKNGEEKLLGNVSIAVGGHVELEDVQSLFYTTNDPDHTSIIDLNLTIGENVWREFHEEVIPDTTQETLNIEDDFSFEPLNWLIVDDSNAVGRVHFAILYQVYIPQGYVSKLRNEDEHELVGWLTFDELRALNQDESQTVENWSKLVIEKLDEIFPKQNEAVV